MRWTRFALCALLATGFSFAAPTTVRAGCLGTPAPSNTVTSLYGWRFHPVFKKWRLHRGADFRAQLDANGQGVQLVAAQSGTVQVAFSASGGNELRIVGADGTITRYLHLTRALVTPGTQVTEGQVVAMSGNTGEASAAPHLHFEVYAQGKNDVNPETMLCSAPMHKAGADQVDGFPVLACNPDGGQQCAGAPAPPAGSGPSPGQGTAPDSSSTAGGGAPPPAPTTSAWDDMSTMEMITSEVTKRFANPDWYRETADRPVGPLWQDYQHMLALHNYIAMRKQLTNERIEQLWAALSARGVRTEMGPRLDRARTVVNRSGSP